LDENQPKKRNKVKKGVEASSCIGTITFNLSPSRNRKNGA